MSFKSHEIELFVIETICQREEKKLPNVSVIGSLHKKSESHFELVDGKTSFMLQMPEEFAVNNTL
jgi:hypothetical protein